METIEKDVLIFGGGLTGLTIAYLLRDKNLSIGIVEARPHLGGRIQTIRKPDQAPVEMGATWLGNKHTELNELLRSLELETFEQELGDRAIYEPLSTSPPQLVQLPKNEDDASFRIKGGTDNIINAISNKLSKNTSINLGEKVVSIDKTDLTFTVKSQNSEFRCKTVVSTLPPALLAKTIKINPSLPQEVVDVANSTHTWMGESIKIALHYKEPFWQHSNSSGTIFSNVGPIPEMYDHSDFEKKHFALKGFLNGSYHAVTKQERLELILNQLKKYYGDIVDSYTFYEEKVWRKESLTYTSYDQELLPHQNNGSPYFQNVYVNDSFFIAGSETADKFPGYLEGAIRSAQFVASRIRRKQEKF